MGFAKYAEDNYEIQEERRMYTGKKYFYLEVADDYRSYWSTNGKMTATSFQRMKEAGVFKARRR